MDEITRLIHDEMQKFPKSSGEIVVFSKEGYCVLEENIPNLSMVGNIGIFGAHNTDNQLEFRVKGRGADIFFKFYPASDYPRGSVKDKVVSEIA